MKNLNIRVDQKAKKTGSKDYRWLATVHDINNNLDSVIMVFAYYRFGVYQVVSVGKRVPLIDHGDIGTKEDMLDYCEKAFVNQIEQIERILIN